jgi:hypothetical protein
MLLHLQRVKGSRLVTELLRVRRYDLAQDRYETDPLYAGGGERPATAGDAEAGHVGSQTAARSAAP